MQHVAPTRLYQRRLTQETANICKYSFVFAKRTHVLPTCCLISTQQDTAQLCETLCLQICNLLSKNSNTFVKDQIQYAYVRILERIDAIKYVAGLLGEYSPVQYIGFLRFQSSVLQNVCSLREIGSVLSLIWVFQEYSKLE